MPGSAASPCGHESLLTRVPVRHRRALLLYGILVGAGTLMDLAYLVAGAAASWLAVGFAFVQLGLKLAVRPG